MPPTEVDPWLAGMVAALAAASLTTWLVLVNRWWHQPILRYEPRRPVPWNAAATLLALLVVTMAIASTLQGGRAGKEPELTSFLEHIHQVALSALLQSLLVGAFLAAVVVTSEAKQSDLGLPEFVDELVHDIMIGIIAWLAALVPVFGLQAILVLTFGETSQNPLIQTISEAPNPVLFALGFIAAVVVAPICEEIVFRLLLQGWLEKWEDALLGWRTPALADQLPEQVEFSTNGNTTGEEIAEQALRSIVGPDSQEPPRRGLAGLPHGWLPILVSSLLFSMAHFGYGPDPIPLFLLAVVLGYTYQRTHRIVPCMVTHALFNVLTLIALWRIASAAE